MMGAMSGIFWVIYSLVMLVALGLWLVWFYYSVRFFSRASEYYRQELERFQKRDEDMKELLAKFDQLVDVLKVK